MLFAPNAQGYIDHAVVLDWFSTCSDAISKQKSTVINWLANGGLSPVPVNLPDAALYATPEYLEQYFSEVLRELELSAVLWLVTYCEGRLRVDLRGRLKDTDFLAAQMKKLHDSKNEEFLIPLVDDGILDCWKSFMRHQVPQPQQDKCVHALGAIKSSIKLRHWLAHGRYWDAKLNISDFEIASVNGVLSKFFDGLAVAVSTTGIRDLA